MFGNVNVDYKPCKTVKQLTRACNYILGRNPEQIQQGVVKTAGNLYFAFDGNRDNFADDILLTRRLFRKPCNGKNNLAYKMSISFHPDDNEHLTYQQAFQIAKEFAEKYFHSRGFDVFLQFIPIPSISMHISSSETAIVTQEKHSAEISMICMRCLSFSVSSAKSMV